MSDKTRIEWTEMTWNPVSGCTKISQGCKHCYAEREFPRVYGRDSVTAMERGVMVTRPREFTDIVLHEERLEQPLHKRRARKIFVNSMTDLFHESVPFEFIDRVFAVMACAYWHTFQVLTKRPERMLEYLRQHAAGGRHVWRAGQALTMPKGLHKPDPGWPLPNVWLGVSVEDQATADERIPLLLQTPAAVRWISAEPLLGAIDLRLERLAEWNALLAEHHGDLDGVHIDWVVVGGESGPKARPMHPAWVRSLRDQCLATGIAFNFKQHGEWLATALCDDDMAMIPAKRTAYVRPDGTCLTSEDPIDFFGGDEETAWVGKKSAGRLLDGVLWDQYPSS